MSSDIWSIGCILIELYTGSLLFGTHENREHLAMMEKVLGRFPSHMLQRAQQTTGSKYIKNGRFSWPENASPSSRRAVQRCCDIEVRQALADQTNTTTHTYPSSHVRVRLSVHLCISVALIRSWLSRSIAVLPSSCVTCCRSTPPVAPRPPRPSATRSSRPDLTVGPTEARRPDDVMTDVTDTSTEDNKEERRPLVC